MDRRRPTGSLRRPPINYQATALHAQASEGLIDDNACVPLQRADGGFVVREFSVGDTDAPFVDWPAPHGLPDAILGGDGWATSCYGRS